MDDPSTFEELRELYHIDFPRQKPNFDEWHQPALNTVSAIQRVFWKPVFDHTNDLIRTGFGLEFATSRDPDTPGAVQSKNSKASSETPLLDNKLQRLSVYLQLRYPHEASDSSPEERHENHEIRQNLDNENASGRTDKVENNYLTDNTIIMFLKTTESSPGGAFLPETVPWNEILEDTNLTRHHPNHPIALAMIILLFEAVSTEWNDYIYSTHRDIVALEE